MKWIIAITVSVLALGLAGRVLIAQEATSRPAHPGGCIGKALNLTDEQKAKIKEIMTQARSDAAKAATPQDKQKIMQAARQTVRDSVLTADQRATLDKIRQRMHARMAVFAQLNLTDDQKTQIKAIVQQARVDAQKAASPADKKAVWQAAREKIKTTVLTDAQRKQLEEMKAKHAASQPARTAA